jgi:hypothetical protein
MLAFVVAASAGGEAVSIVKAQPPVVGETYWVRRVEQWFGTRCGPADTASGCESHGRTACTPLTFDGVELALGPPTRGRGRVTLRAGRRPDGRWDLAGVRLTVGAIGVGIELGGSCLTRIAIDEAQLFTDRARCEAVPSEFHATCEGSRCASSAAALANDAWTFEEPAPRPFFVGGCEQAISEVGARAALVTYAEYADIERTFRRFSRIAEIGGALYERHGASCDAVSVSPPVTESGTRVTTLTARWRDSDGVVTRHRSRYVLRPLLASAYWLGAEESWFLHGRPFDGQGSGSGSGPTGLYLGKAVVLLDHRTLYLDRGCSPPH